MSSPGQQAAQNVGNAAFDYGLLPESFVQQIQVLSVRYGDIVKLCATSHYPKLSPKSSSSPSATKSAQSTKSTKSAISKSTKSAKAPASLCSSRSIGLYRKADGTTRIALSLEVEDAQRSFTEVTYRVESARREKHVGSNVCYGDVVRLVDSFGMVWNDSKGGRLRPGYLIPSKPGEPGEIFLRFVKTGKNGMEVLYNEPGVFMEMVDLNRCLNAKRAGERATRLSNYKPTNSQCQSGYVCRDRRGVNMAVSIYKAS